MAGVVGPKHNIDASVLLERGRFTRNKALKSQSIATEIRLASIQKELCEVFPKIVQKCSGPVKHPKNIVDRIIVPILEKLLEIGVQSSSPEKFEDETKAQILEILSICLSTINTHKKYQKHAKNVFDDLSLRLTNLSPKTRGHSRENKNWMQVNCRQVFNESKSTDEMDQNTNLSEKGKTSDEKAEKRLEKRVKTDGAALGSQRLDTVDRLKAEYEKVCAAERKRLKSPSTARQVLFPDVTEKIPIRVMANTILDKMTKGSHYKGGFALNHINLCERALETLAADEKGDIYKECRRQLEHAKKFEWLKQEKMQGKMNLDPAIIDSVKNEIGALKNKGDSLMFPCEYRGIDTGHAMMMEIVNEGDTFSVRIFNSGDGLEFHESIVTDKGQRVRPFYKICNIAKEAFENDTLIKLLFEPGAVRVQYERNSYNIYDIYVRYTEAFKAYGGKVDRLTTDKESISPEEINTQFILPQRSGTCSQKSINAYLRQVCVESNNLPFYKKMKWAIQKQALKEAFNKQVSGKFINEDELYILSEACEVFARSALKLYENNKDEVVLKETLAVIEQIKSTIEPLIHALENPKSDCTFEVSCLEHDSRIINPKDIHTPENTQLPAVPEMPKAMPQKVVFDRTSPVESCEKILNGLDPENGLSESGFIAIQNFVETMPIPTPETSFLYEGLEETAQNEMAGILSKLIEKLLQFNNSIKKTPGLSISRNPAALLTYARVFCNLLALADSSKNAWLKENMSQIRLPNLLKRFAVYQVIQSPKQSADFEKMITYLNTKEGNDNIFDERKIRNASNFNRAFVDNNGPNRDLLDRLLTIPEIKEAVTEGVKQQAKKNKAQLGTDEQSDLEELLLPKHNILECHLRGELKQNLAFYLNEKVPILCQIKYMAACWEALDADDADMTTGMLDHEAFLKEKSRTFESVLENPFKKHRCEHIETLNWVHPPGGGDEDAQVESVTSRQNLGFNLNELNEAYLNGVAPEFVAPIIDFYNSQRDYDPSYQNAAVLWVENNKDVKRKTEKALNIATHPSVCLNNLIDTFSQKFFSKLLSNESYQKVLHIYLFNMNLLEKTVQRTPLFAQKLVAFIEKGIRSAIKTNNLEALHFFSKLAICCKETFIQVQNSKPMAKLGTSITRLSDLDIVHLKGVEKKINDSDENKRCHLYIADCLISKADLSDEELCYLLSISVLSNQHLAKGKMPNAVSHMAVMARLHKEAHRVEDLLSSNANDIVDTVLGWLNMSRQSACKLKAQTWQIVVDDIEINFQSGELLKAGQGLAGLPDHIRSNLEYHRIPEAIRFSFIYNQKSDEYYSADNQFRYRKSDGNWRLERFFVTEENGSWAMAYSGRKPTSQFPAEFQDNRYMWLDGSKNICLLTDKDIDTGPGTLREICRFSENGDVEIEKAETPNLKLSQKFPESLAFLRNFEHLGHVLLWVSDNPTVETVVELPRYGLKFVQKLSPPNNVTWELDPSEEGLRLSENQIHDACPQSTGHIILENNKRERYIISPLQKLSVKHFSRVIYPQIHNNNWYGADKTRDYLKFKVEKVAGTTSIELTATSQKQQHLLYAINLYLKSHDFEAVMRCLNAVHSFDNLTENEERIVEDIFNADHHPTTIAMLARLILKLKSPTFEAARRVFAEYKSLKGNVSPKYQLLPDEEKNLDELFNQTEMDGTLLLNRDAWKTRTVEYSSGYEKGPLSTLCTATEIYNLFSDKWGGTIGSQRTTRAKEVLQAQMREIRKDRVSNPKRLFDKGKGLNFLTILDDAFRIVLSGSEVEKQQLRVEMIRFMPTSDSERDKYFLNLKEYSLDESLVKPVIKTHAKYIFWSFIWALLESPETLEMYMRHESSKDALEAGSERLIEQLCHKKDQNIILKIAESMHELKTKNKSRKVWSVEGDSRENEATDGAVSETVDVRGDSKTIQSLNQAESRFSATLLSQLPTVLHSHDKINEQSLLEMGHDLSNGTKLHWENLVSTLTRHQEGLSTLNGKKKEADIAKKDVLKLKAQLKTRVTSLETLNAKIIEQIMTLLWVLPQKNDVSKLLRLKMQAGKIDAPEMMPIMVAFFNQDPEYLLEKYPALKASSNLDIVWKAIHTYFQIQTEKIHLGRVLGLITKLETTCEEKMDTKTKEKQRHYLASIRNLLQKERAYNLLDAPEIMVLETILGFRLNQEQVDAVNEFIHSASDKNPLNNLVKNLIMGSGKSSVIHVLLALRLSKQTKGPVVLHVPQALLAANQDHLFRVAEKSLGRKVVTFHFDRDSDTSISTLDTRYDQLQRVVKNNGVIIATPQAIQSLFLKLQENMVALKEAKVKRRYRELETLIVTNHRLVKLLDLFATGVAMFDEAHLLFDCRNEVTFPTGEAENLSPAHSDVIESILLDLRIRHRGNLPDTLSEDDKIAIAKNYIEKLQGMGVEVDTDSALSYALGQTESLPRIRSGKWAEKNMKLLKNAILNILPFTLRKVVNRDYGLNEKLEGNHCPVPLLAAKLPKERSEFAHPDVLLAFTHQYYIQQGLSSENIEELVTLLIDSSLTNVEDNSLLDQLSKAIISAVKVRSISEVDMLNPKDLEAITTCLKTEPIRTLGIRVFLDKIAYPEIKYYPTFVSSTAYDLQALFYSKVLGDTGSFDNSTWSVQMSGTSDPKTDGEVFYNLLAHSRGAKKVDTRTTDTLLKEMAEDDDFKACRALIDAGALFKDESSDSVAEKLYEYSQEIPQVKGVLYFNKADQNRLWVVYKENGRFIKRPATNQTIENPNEWITYYDHANITGADVDQDILAMGYVTVGKNMSDNDANQAAMRLRQLSSGQRIKWLVDENIADEIPELTSAPILKWALKNRYESKKRDRVFAIQSQYEHLRRQETYQRLLEQFRGKEDDAVQSEVTDELIALNESVFVTQTQFEDPVDFRLKTVKKEDWIEEMSAESARYIKTLDDQENARRINNAITDRATEILDDEITLKSGVQSLGATAQIEVSVDNDEEEDLSVDQSQLMNIERQKKKQSTSSEKAFDAPYRWITVETPLEVSQAFNKVSPKLNISKDLLLVGKEDKAAASLEEGKSEREKSTGQWGRKSCAYFLRQIDADGEDRITLLSDYDVDQLIYESDAAMPKNYEIYSVSDGTVFYKAGKPLPQRLANIVQVHRLRLLITLLNGEWPQVSKTPLFKNGPSDTDLLIELFIDNKPHEDATSADDKDDECLDEDMFECIRKIWGYSFRKTPLCRWEYDGLPKRKPWFIQETVADTDC